MPAAPSMAVLAAEFETDMITDFDLNVDSNGDEGKCTSYAWAAVIWFALSILSFNSLSQINI
jgi:hypothetical protein